VKWWGEKLLGRGVENVSGKVENVPDTVQSSALVTLWEGGEMEMEEEGTLDEWKKWVSGGYVRGDMSTINRWCSSASGVESSSC